MISFDFDFEEPRGKRSFLSLAAMLTTCLSSRSYQSIMNDETLCDDLTTLNHNSSSSIFYRSMSIQYLSQKYFLSSENERMNLMGCLFLQKIIQHR